MVLGLDNELPTRRRPEIGRILVTGASGYIGGRLVTELLHRGYQVRVMIRAPAPEYEELWPQAEVAVADALDPARLTAAFRGVDVAYYLIHSLLLGPRDFAWADIEAATNFRLAAQECGIKRIIYLGGLGDDRSLRSLHLRSRMEVARELGSGPVPLTSLRAAVIIGSGSASYEILKHLVRRLPVLPIPHWTKNRCQPISIRDVIKYLIGVLETPESAGQSYDIGGPDILSYEGMMRTLAGILRKKRYFASIPFPDTRVYAYLASLLTPVPGPITRSLLEGIKDEVVCKNDEIRRLIPFELLSYHEAVIRAMSREERDEVYTRWTDAYPPAHRLAIKLHELKEAPRFSTTYALWTEKSAEALFASICRIGGKDGWFHNNWMWRLRGALDRILMGVGSSRGRKTQSRLRINDVIDFWRIEDVRTNQRLLLRAEMKLPGKAWLEFLIEDKGDRRKLSVKAYFTTNKLFGVVYWYNFLPFHHLIFQGLIEQIDKRG